MGRGDLGGDIETEPQTLRTVGVASSERLKEPLPGVSRDRRAGVGNRQLEEFPVRLPGHADRDISGPVGNGVPEKVRQHLANADVVERDLVVDAELSLDGAVRVDRPQLLKYASEEGRLVCERVTRCFCG